MRCRSRSPLLAVSASLIVVFWITLTTLCESPASATNWPGFCDCVTDSAAVFHEPSVTKPGYLAWRRDSTFRTPMTRAAGDSGTAITQLSGACGSLPGPTWGALSFHNYSKDQPWNSDGSLLMITNPTQPATNFYTGGCPPSLILDGNSYAPLQSGVCTSVPVVKDSRWQPSTAYPRYRIAVSYVYADTLFDPRLAILDSLLWIDITTCAVVRRWALPIRPTEIGEGEGNASFDGRWIAISTNHSSWRIPPPDSIVVVDMSDPTQSAVWPAYEIPPCSLSVCKIGNVSISPSGQYVDVKYADNADSHRIFKVDTTHRTLSIENMAAGSERCSAYGPNGWILPLKHADMTIDPADGQDVIVGGNRCTTTLPFGRVAKVRLSDGAVTYVSNGTVGGITENYVEHVSTRCFDRPGWAYVSYDTVADGDSTVRYGSEVVAWSLDGNKHAQRFGHAHAYEKDTLTSNSYYHEIHPVPSRDGRRILFASNWTSHVSGAVPNLREVKDYILDARNLPPSTIGDLGSELPTTTTIPLKWTAPSDRGVGVMSYELRYSQSLITDSTFVSATPLISATPNYPGFTERDTVQGLVPNTQYFFAIKSRSSCDSSALSNVYCVFTLNPNGPSRSCSASPQRHAQVAGAALRLFPALPNPAHGMLTIRYSLPDDSPAQLLVFDVSGRRVAGRDLRLDHPGEGYATIPERLSPGVYFVKLVHPRGVLQTTAIVLR